MNVRELVAGEVVWVSQSTTVSDAAQVMVEFEVGAVAVGTNGVLEGIMTERDVLRACASGLAIDDIGVGDMMTAYPDSFDPDMSVESAAEWLVGAGYRHLPVVEHDNVIGMVSIKDVLWAVMASRHSE